MEKIKKKYSKTDCLILGIGFLILGLFVLSIAIPIVYVVLASFMDPTVLNNQGLSFHIKDWTLDAYRRVLENEMIWRGFLNSFLYSLAFTVISVFVTLLAAYPLSKKEFVGRKIFNIIIIHSKFYKQQTRTGNSIIFISRNANYRIHRTIRLSLSQYIFFVCIHIQTFNIRTKGICISIIATRHCIQRRMTYRINRMSPYDLIIINPFPHSHIY